MSPPPTEDRAIGRGSEPAADRWAVALVIALLAATCAMRVARPVDREAVVPTPTGYRLPVNLASAGELEALPAVGPALARAIVDHRSADGPFDSHASLQRVRGIGPKTADRIAPWIDLAEPTESARP